MKKCLLILPRPIFPQVCGYAIKNYSLLNVLSKKYNIKLVVITNCEISKEELDYYDEKCEEYVIWKIPKWKSLLNTILALFKKEPLQVAYYYDDQLQKKVVELSNDCDVLIASLVRTRKYLNEVDNKEAKIVFDMVDSISLNYEVSSKETKSIFWKIIYRIESKRLRIFEEKSIQNSNVTFLFNPDEKAYWDSIGNVVWLPHGTDERLFNYDRTLSDIEKSVVFLGKMDYQPNVDAVLWYLKNVHPQLPQDLKFIIVGAYPSKEIIKASSRFTNVIVTGYVDDPYIYANSCMAMIAPMFTGGGIQNKVLEGMALGKVNIVSTKTAKAIKDLVVGKEVLVADTPSEYIENILDIYVNGNDDKYKFIERSARKFIKENFTWEKYGEQYCNALEK